MPQLHFMYVSFFMIFFIYLVCFHFNFAMDPINFDPADPGKTPLHIYPEWYFLWQYEILRGFFFDIPLGFMTLKAADIGSAAMGFAGISLILMPLLDRSDVVAPAHKRPAFFIWFWIFLIDLIILTIYGKLPPTDFNAWVGFYASVGYLVLLLVVLPIITIKERKAAK